MELTLNINQEVVDAVCDTYGHVEGRDKIAFVERQLAVFLNDVYAAHVLEVARQQAITAASEDLEATRATLLDKYEEDEPTEPTEETIR